MTQQGKICSINISDKKGVPKTPVTSAVLVVAQGLQGDAHVTSGLNQVSLLANESIDKMRAQTTHPLNSGDFAENITTTGLVLHELPIGTVLEVGEAELEVSKIGKECHHGCAIKQQVGTCIMPQEGIFARVLRGGKVQPGDPILVRA